MHISKIVLKLSDDEVLNLTIDQAKELQKLLNYTFDHKDKETIYVPITLPNYGWNPWWQPSILTCDSGTSNSTKEESSICFSLKPGISGGTTYGV